MVKKWRSWRWLVHQARPVIYIHSQRAHMHAKSEFEGEASEAKRTALLRMSVGPICNYQCNLDDHGIVYAGSAGCISLSCLHMWDSDGARDRQI